MRANINPASPAAAASRTGVENVREEIIGRVQFAPTRGGYKIYIIDEVHMLSTAAFNALLKVVEEPPSHVIFVLCTTDAHKVPDTVKSRCQQFEFHRLSEEQISARLEYIGKQEGYKAEPEALSLIAQRSQGGMRDAISSLEQVAVFTGNNITFEAAESLLGEVSSEQLFSVSDLLAERNVAGCFAWVASFAQSGTDIAQFVRDLSSHIRNVYIASVLGEDAAAADIIQADEQLTKRYVAQARSFASPDRLAYVLVILGELSMQLRYSANARLALEIALTRIARPDSDLTLESLAARVAILEEALAKGIPSNNGKQSGVVETTASSPSLASARDGEEQYEAVPYGDDGFTVATPSTATPSISTPTAATAPQAAASRTDTADAVANTPSVVESASTAVPAPSAAGATDDSEDEPTSSLLDAGAAHRLWVQVIRELQAKNKISVVTFLGGSSVRVDAKTNGLSVELPRDATFALQNLERAENKDLVASIVEKVHGKPLPFKYELGTGVGQSGADDGRRVAVFQESVSSAADRRSEDFAAIRSDGGKAGNASVAGGAQIVAAGNGSTINENDTPDAAGTTSESGMQQETLSFEDILSSSFGAEISVDKIDT